MNKKIVLIFGLVLRELLSFWTAHPYDFEVWVRLGYYVSKGSNPYTFLYYVDGISFAPYKVLLSIGYPPLWGLICGSIYKTYQIVFEGLSLHSPFVYYFLLKQPIIFGDFLVGIIFYKMLAQDKTDCKLLIFWILNPITIILSGVWGIFDSLTFALLLLSIRYTVFDRKDTISGILLGVATSLKLIPLIFAPINLRFATRKLNFVLFFTFTILITSILPFFLFNWSFKGFFHAMESQAINIREQPVVGGMTIFSLLEPITWGYLNFWTKSVITPLNFLWIVAFSSFYVILYFKPTKELDLYGILRWHIIAILLFFLTRLYIAEQYVLYIVGFMIMDVFMFHPGRKTLLNTICILSLIYLVLNNTFLVRFLSPIASWAFFWDITFNNAPPTQTLRHILRLLCGSLFYVSTFQLLYIYSKNQRKETKSWVAAKVKGTLNIKYLKYYLYLFSLTLNALFLDYIIVNMVKDWRLALDERLALNLPLFGLYHLLMITLTIGFDISICLFMRGELEDRFKAFARLLLLNVLMTGIAQPIFQALRGKTPLSGELVFAVYLMLDERLFVAITVIVALLGLFIVEDAFNLVKKVRHVCKRPECIRSLWSSFRFKRRPSYEKL